MTRANANKLDAMLVLMFDFIERACLADGTPAAAPHQPPAQSARQQLFESLLSAFETSLLYARWSELRLGRLASGGAPLSLEPHA